MEKGYNILEVAELLGIKARTVRDWIKRGKIHAQKLSGSRRWVILESEIRRLRNENTD